MRRKKGRSMYSFCAMISAEATTTIIWASIISICFFAYCSCDDAKSNTKSNGHVKSTTPIIRTEVTESIHVKNEKITKQHNSNIDNTFVSNQSSINDGLWQGKRTFIRSGNELWDGLIDDCLQKPSFSCFQKNVYTYLDNTLKLNDVNVTDRIQFKRIDIDPSLMAQLKNDDDNDNEISAEETRDYQAGMFVNYYVISMKSQQLFVFFSNCKNHQSKK